MIFRRRLSHMIAWLLMSILFIVAPIALLALVIPGLMRSVDPVLVVVALASAIALRTGMVFLHKDIRSIEIQGEEVIIKHLFWQERIERIASLIAEVPRREPHAVIRKGIVIRHSRGIARIGHISGFEDAEALMSELQRISPRGLKVFVRAE